MSVLQMAIPGKGHENIRRNQKQDRRHRFYLFLGACRLLAAKSVKSMVKAEVESVAFFIFPAEGRQCIEFAHVDFVTTNSQMRPGFLIADLSLIDQFETVRIRFDQQKPA